MKTKDIMDLVNMPYEDLMKLMTKENEPYFQSLVEQLSKTANSRLRKLKSSEFGKLSPAFKFATKGGKKTLSFKHQRKTKTKMEGNLHNELMQHFARVKRFLNMQSSTVSGWKGIRKHMSEITKSDKLFRTEFKSERSRVYWTNRENEYWSMYSKLLDDYGGIIKDLDSNRVQAMLSRVFEKKKFRKGSETQDAVVEAMRKYIELASDLSNASSGLTQNKLINQMKSWEEEFIM